MSNVPPNLRYAKSHEWVRLEADGTATVGITDYAQNSLGDITYAQFPKVGAVLKAGETFGVVESVKAASDVYTPISGTVLAINSAVDKTPETLNRDPYGEAWLIKLAPANLAEVDHLMDKAGYEKATA
ncbi:MAG: glycine cleavage system protein GcvH [Verrucomicrobia bacterium]|jgi:glycine cleavage system H protein|nr:MAG: glycine cleavage system protein GcvH [Verrucomicrobiota bacterium]